MVSRLTALMAVILAAGVGALGDIMLSRDVGDYVLWYGPDYPFAASAPLLSQANLAIGNLECALTGDQVVHTYTMPYTFLAPPSFGGSLPMGGIDVVSLANNHADDGGRRGLRDTMAALTGYGVQYVGAGRNWAESRQPRIIFVNGWRVAFLAYCDKDVMTPTATEAGANSLDPVGLAESEIRAAHRIADLVIVMVHWGRENWDQPTLRQRRLASRMVRVGADVVIGSHPHRLQPVISYCGRTIAYSLGNFVFDNHVWEQQWTEVLWITVQPNHAQSVVQYPYRIVDCQPQPY
jgi:poly-gamma-glutamate capsule biosynthesis protein CapA/YwtB (metallophosphatase superfamily)